MRYVPILEQNHVAGHLTISTYKNDVLIRRSEPMPNKVVSGTGGHGRNLIARQLAGDTTYPLAITSAAAGSGSTAPADGDTGLETPVASNIPITRMIVTNNVLQVDVFVSSANLANGTYREFGLFCGAQLFARIIISPDYTKASGEDTLFTYTLTLTG